MRTNGSAAAYAVLSPRQHVTPAPTAIYAESAAAAATASSAGTASAVAANAVGSGGIQDGVITAAKLAPGQVVKALNGLTDSVILSAGTNITLTTNGNALQISSVAGGGSGSSSSVARTGDTMTGTLNLAAPAGINFGSNTRQMLNLYDIAYGIGVQGNTLYQRTAANSGFAWYQGGTHTNAQNNAGGGNTLMTLDSDDNLTASGNVVASGAVSGDSIASDGSGSGMHGTGGLIGTIGIASRGVIGESYNNDGVLGTSVRNGVHDVSTGGADSAVWGENTGGGYGVTGTSDVGNGLGVYGRGHSKGVYGLTSTAGPSHAGVFGENSAVGGTAVVGNALAANSSGVAGVADTAGSTGVYGRGALWAGYFDGPISVCTLTIRGGCDVAEPFQMSHQDIPKGSVVVIDDQNTGRLKLSDRAYDTRVAGIVSGANGIHPGIALHQDGVLEGGQNVALSGRVYVLADASTSAIKPGDLLTTSNTPGHAMKVIDQAGSHGAVIGKAMSSLKEGRGMVLVLVTLQ